MLRPYEEGPRNKPTGQAYPSRLRARRLGATADEPVAEHLLPRRSDLGLHQRVDCANLFLRLLLLFRLLFESAARFNLRTFFVSHPLYRGVSELAKDARLPLKDVRKRVHQIAFIFKGTHL